MDQRRSSIACAGFVRCIHLFDAPLDLLRTDWTAAPTPLPRSVLELVPRILRPFEAGPVGAMATDPWLFAAVSELQEGLVTGRSLRSR
jgi:hypothetical protein